VPNVLLHYGVGVGLRYRAPFGSIAIDLAHPLDRDASPVRLHLGVRIGI
jgi:translocation and assembly module TamA